MAEPSEILKREEMEVARSPAELCAWVAAKASELAQSKEGKAYARSGEILPKKLMEEMRPFGLFALQRYGPESVKCIPNLGNENFDGEIRFTDMKASTYVELTYAKDGYDEHLRLQVLTEQGWVNALGGISVTGTKAAGSQRVMVANEAMDHDVTVSRQLALVMDRLSHKSGKKYGSRHVLVVVIDDQIAFREEKGKSDLVDCAKAWIGRLEFDFGGIYLLGASGEYLVRVHGEI